jgi:hypothetical protein
LRAAVGPVPLRTRRDSADWLELAAPPSLPLRKDAIQPLSFNATPLEWNRAQANRLVQ